MRQRVGLFGSNPNNRFRGGRSHVPSIAKLEEEGEKRRAFEAQQAENLARTKKVRPEVGLRTLKKTLKQMKRIRNAQAKSRRPRKVDKASLETAVALLLK
jgi:hypothetical protein